MGNFAPKRLRAICPIRIDSDGLFTLRYRDFFFEASMQGMTRTSATPPRMPMQLSRPYFSYASALLDAWIQLEFATLVGEWNYSQDTTIARLKKKRAICRVFYYSLIPAYDGIMYR